MAQVSYSDVFSLDLERELDEEILSGDVVRTGANFYPHFRVIAVHGDKVWVRNVDTDVDGLTTVNRCRKINGPPPV
jgi:hypothetical protein